MLNVPIVAVLILAGAGWMILWLSPSMLGSLAARMLARRDAIRTQRMALAWWGRRFEEDRCE